MVASRTAKSQSALFHPGALRARTAPRAASGKNRLGYCRTWKLSGIRKIPTAKASPHTQATRREQPSRTNRAAIASAAKG